MCILIFIILLSISFAMQGLLERFPILKPHQQRYTVKSFARRLLLTGDVQTQLVEGAYLLRNALQLMLDGIKQFLQCVINAQNILICNILTQMYCFLVEKS